MHSHAPHTLIFGATDLELRWIGGTCGAAVAWPQAWRLWVGRQHQGLSASSNVLAVFYGIGWTSYGIWQQSPSMIVTNGSAMLSAVAVPAGHVWLAKLAVREWLPLLAGTLAALAVVALVGGSTAVGSVVGVSVIIAVGVQVLSLVRQRRAGDYDTSGVSVPRWWLSVFCNAMWLIFGVLAGDPIVLVTSTTNTVLSALVIVLTIPPRNRPAAAAEEQVEAAA